jgi:hypothetical protein
MYMLELIYKYLLKIALHAYWEHRCVFSFFQSLQVKSLVYNLLIFTKSSLADSATLEIFWSQSDNSSLIFLLL